jgi:DNA-binding beta-propeller fold protein YncE
MKSASRLSGLVGSAVIAVAAWLLPTGNLEAQVAAPGWTVTVHAMDVSTVSGGEALAADLDTGNVIVKSLQDPAGSPVQLTEVTPSGAATILATYPGLRNADISGVALDPLTGGIIVADEAGNRIALVNRSTLGVSTLFDIPWVMNPASNGTGQQQYAPDPGDPDVLYFWDSSVSKVFRLDRATNTLLEILALDQASPDGQHLATYTNDLVLDPATGTLLVTDGASNSVLEVDPGTSPPTVTTLFSGFISRPTAIALNPSTDEVFIADSGSIFVGSRAGGSLSLVASGFASLADIVVGTASTGAGLSLFAVDKALDTIYEIVAQVGPPASKEQCKNGGWERFNTPQTFKNQGECIQFFNTSG